MKKIVILVIVCVVASAGLMVWGFHENQSTRTEAPPHYALLTTLDRGTVVMQLKQGAQTAAEATGAELSILTTEEGDSQDAQLVAMVARLAESGVDGIILPPCGEEAFAQIRKITQERNIPLLCLWMDEAEADAFIVTDYYAQGVLLAESAGQADAVLAGEDMQSQLRVEGIRSVLGENIPVYQDVASFDALPEGSILLVTDAGLTDSAATLSLHMWGIDPGDTRVDLLESGAADGLVMELPYAQGYQAVDMLHALHRREDVPHYLYTESRMITAETMYDSENVKLVFPLLQ